MSYLVFSIVLLLLISLTILSLYLTYQIDRLESKLEGKQRLIRASRRSLALAEDQIAQRNDLLKYQEDIIKNLQNKITVYETYMTSNSYGNAEIRLNKLKELVRDYQSQN